VSERDKRRADQGLGLTANPSREANLKAKAEERGRNDRSQKATAGSDKLQLEVGHVGVALKGKAVSEAP